MQQQKTTFSPPATNRQWFLFDATGKTLGRFSSEIAKILRGKHRLDHAPHQDRGDGVIIINAAKVRVTGNKAARKVYRYYTGSIGGERKIPYRVMQEKKPHHILFHAIRGMMPKTRLSRKQMTRLRIFATASHSLTANQPIDLRQVSQ